MFFFYCSLSPSYRYPVIVFVEDDLDNDVGRRTIRSFTGSDDLSQSRLFIQVVRFRIPDFITGRVPPRAGNGKSVGYRHMCRFHAKTVYEEPTIGFKYADGRPVIEYTWRLDDDSFLYRPIKYDPFAFMRDRQLLYGYIQVLENNCFFYRCAKVNRIAFNLCSVVFRDTSGVGRRLDAHVENYLGWALLSVFKSNSILPLN